MKFRVALALLAALLLSGPGLAETSSDRTEPIEIQVEGPEQVLRPQEDRRILVRPHDLEEDHQQIDVLFNWEGKRAQGGGQGVPVAVPCPVVPSQPNRRHSADLFHGRCVRDDHPGAGTR